MNETRRLRKLHLSLIEQVTILFDIDLVKSKHLWKDKIDVKNDMKDMDILRNNYFLFFFVRE